MGEAGCGLLTDNFAQMWGDIKDSVDELKAVMAANQAACKAREDALNTEIASMTSMLSQKNVELTEATGALNGDTEEQSEKITEKTMIEKEYEEVHGECTAVLHDILFTKICGTKTVRAELAKVADSFDPTDILDCEVGDWVAQECSKPCIPLDCTENCTPGEQDMTRTVTQEASLGAACPALKLVKTCGDIKCPIDCVQSAWSEFGKCTKECGGGVQQRSRNVEQRAMYGGEACAANSESQQCNVQSCDVDCMLGEWTPWMPCSKACGGGTQERLKPVAVPLAGKGICFGEKAIERYEATTCNEDPCPAVATCSAVQDLVLVVDVSGSFQQAGFDLMSAFVQNLTSLYAMGPAAAQIAIVEYSNVGKLVVPLTGDVMTLQKGISNIQFQRGITDMAAGLSLAKTALLEGRKDAQSVVVVLTDGKPSFQFATRNAASALRDSGVRLVVAPIMTFGDPSFMEELASDPPADNVLNINGLEHLKANGAAEAMMVMTSTCPKLDTPAVAATAGLDVAKVLAKADARHMQRRVHPVTHRRGH
jgi:Mg-chelatase subunit ChlD